MNLFNKKLLTQQIARYDFPSGDKLQKIQAIIEGWQKALKDSDLGKTKEKSVQGKFLNKFFEQILHIVQQLRKIVYGLINSFQSEFH